MEDQSKAKVNDQRQEMESIINRHLGMIEQLLGDKKELNEQLASLT
jgi:hypothetical protein